MIILFQAVVAILMAIAGDVMQLIDFLSFTGWIFYGLVFLGNVIMRYQVDHT